MKLITYLLSPVQASCGPYVSDECPPRSSDVGSGFHVRSVEVLRGDVALNCSLPCVLRSAYSSAASGPPLQGLLRESTIRHPQGIAEPLPSAYSNFFTYRLLFRPLPQFVFTDHIVPPYFENFPQTSALKSSHTLLNLSQSFPGFTSIQEHREYDAVEELQFCAE